MRKYVVSDEEDKVELEEDEREPTDGDANDDRDMDDEDEEEEEGDSVSSYTERKSGFMKWIGKLFKGGSNRGRGGHHLQPSVVWRAPFRSLLSMWMLGGEWLLLQVFSLLQQLQIGLIGILPGR